MDTMAQVEIWNEQRAGRFPFDELSQGCTAPGAKGRSAAGEAAGGVERCSRAASAPRSELVGVPVCARRMDWSRARTSASISGLESVKVKQSPVEFGGCGAFARLAAEGLTRV
eukprot:2917396-Pleurochrysis_carterae.AAC.1